MRCFLPSTFNQSENFFLSFFFLFSTSIWSFDINFWGHKVPFTLLGPYSVMHAMVVVDVFFFFFLSLVFFFFFFFLGYSPPRSSFEYKPNMSVIVTLLIVHRETILKDLDKWGGHQLEKNAISFLFFLAHLSWHLFLWIFFPSFSDITFPDYNRNGSSNYN